MRYDVNISLRYIAWFLDSPRLKISSKILEVSIMKKIICTLTLCATLLASSLYFSANASNMVTPCFAFGDVTESY